MSASTPRQPAAAPAKASAPAATGSGGNPARPRSGFDDEAEDGPWRHPPVAPKDEGAATSLGKSVSDVVIGPNHGTDAKQKAP